MLPEKRLPAFFYEKVRQQKESYFKALKPAVCVYQKEAQKTANPIF